MRTLVLWVRARDGTVTGCLGTHCRKRDEEAAASINMMLALSRIAEGQSHLAKASVRTLTEEAPDLIPNLVLTISTWAKSGETPAPFPSRAAANQPHAPFRGTKIGRKSPCTAARAANTSAAAGVIESPLRSCTKLRSERYLGCSRVRPKADPLLANRCCTAAYQKQTLTNMNASEQLMASPATSAQLAFDRCLQQTGEVSMKIPRRPSREVELDDIVWQGVLNGQDDAIDVILKIHLALEALLIEMIELQEPKLRPWEWSFPKKLKFLVSKGVLRDNDERAFGLVNDARNDIAHIFGHRLNVSSALYLIANLESEGIDFSDSPANYDEDTATEYYDGLRGIQADMGWNVLHHASWLLAESGGTDVFSD